MRLMKNSFLASAAALALAASGASAAEVHYNCTGADSPSLNNFLAGAGVANGDDVFIDGTCVVTGRVFLTKSITLEGGPGSSITAPLSTVLSIKRGGAGSTIRNMKLTSAVGNAITNYPQANVGSYDQPDNIHIIGNDLTGARGIQQWNDNAAPLNDVNRVNNLPGGVCSGWVIDGNKIRSTAANNTGILLCGNNTTVTNNEIWATTRGINTQNNFGVGAGSLPSGSGNVISHNLIHLAKVVPPTAGVDDYLEALVLLGCNNCSAAGDANPLLRSSGNVVDKNCMDVNDPTAASQSLGMLDYRVAGDSYTKNDILLGTGVIRPNHATAGEDTVYQGIDSRGGTFANNAAAGAEFDGAELFTFANGHGNPSGNLLDHNDWGPPLDPAYMSFSFYSENVDAANPNLATRNKFSQGGIFVPGPVEALAFLLRGNHTDIFTSRPGDLSQVHDCYQGLGYAGNVSLSVDTPDPSLVVVTGVAHGSNRSLGVDHGGVVNGLLSADDVQTANRPVVVNPAAFAIMDKQEDPGESTRALPTDGLDLGRQTPVSTPIQRRSR